MTKPLFKRAAMVFLVAIFWPAMILAAGDAAQDTGPMPPPKPPAIPTDSTADHSSFPVLQQSFASGPDVTKACLTCHTQADDQLMHSIHFQWEHISERGQLLGKANVVNSFCGGVASNEPRCTSCHTGYGWEEDVAAGPPMEPSAVDCLVCHDRSGQYTKVNTGAGHPPLYPVPEGTRTITGALAWPVDLTMAAQSVGVPGRENCGSCHFYGGGGDNVKHGDLSSVLFAPSQAIDVHMAPDGLNFTCQDCHVSENHKWPGSRYDMVVEHDETLEVSGQRGQAATCESCHTDTPHDLSLVGIKLDDHTDKVACQTCHIPAFARGGVATKTVWDWSTAGQMDGQGKPMSVFGYTQGDGTALKTYTSGKGDAVWEENVVPEYRFFDGHIEYTLVNQEIDPSQPVEINQIHGEYGDGRIWPFKRMEGRQPYDSVLNTLVVSHVWGPDTDTAFWTNFDWSRAIGAGMEAAGAEFSGEHGFIDTHMYWPITHMVAPASDALDCAACHTPDGRLANLTGFHLPGTNPFSPVGLLGMALVLATGFGVFGHWMLRVVAGRRRKDNHHG